ncbi:hypothetical protein [Pontibacter ramchanderi]|uniref:Uncharacterized protein n=1 Tax=Pontibacter ramchanderi TaxID=1179743 RepID=A0A2N3V2E9_9BACT|nr:hypothetical protein [Pontibacter ramchanderi]PKV75815.1 hypothetical protein BD749_0761 [Pontibacter ramchanderi]
MATIIITIVLNVLLGNPVDTTKDQQTTTSTNTTTTTTQLPGDTMNAMGGSGTWTTIEK